MKVKDSGREEICDRTNLDCGARESTLILSESEFTRDKRLQFWTLELRSSCDATLCSSVARFHMLELHVQAARSTCDFPKLWKKIIGSVSLLASYHLYPLHYFQLPLAFIIQSIFLSSQASHYGYLSQIRKLTASLLRSPLEAHCSTSRLQWCKMCQLKGEILRCVFAIVAC